MDLPEAPQSLFSIRPGDHKIDYEYISNTWLKSFQTASINKHIPYSIYKSGHLPHVEAALERSNVLIAHQLSEPDIIHGWIAYERSSKGSIVHYIFVKSIYRKLGIARRLLESVPHPITTYSHRTVDAEMIIRSNPQACYDPYSFYLIS